MSTLGGIYNFDGLAVEDQFLISLGGSLSRRGPDGGRQAHAGSVGMVYRAFHTTSESRFENQPLVSGDGLMLCWDGRLDNREELTGANFDQRVECLTDAAIVMNCYRQWGADFLPKLVGDFALSLWDERQRLLILARDAVGPRPLFYHANNSKIIWASELFALLDCFEVQPEPDDEFIAAYLTHSMEPWMTPFKGVLAVPSAHAVLVRDGQVKVQRHWGLDPSREIRYSSDGEYEEHFRHLFSEAVRVRLRANGPVWAALSGGLDSSSIVFMADEVIRSGKAMASRLETASYVYDEATSSDERTFIHCVEDSRSRPGHHLSDLDDPPLTSFPSPDEIGYPEVIDWFFNRHRRLCKLMEEDGARVLLTGHGGDEVMGSGIDPSGELGDHLIQFHFLNLHRSLKAWSNSLKKPYLKILWADALAKQLPAWLRPRNGREKERLFPPWFDARFLNRMNLRDRFKKICDPFGFRLPSQRDQATGFLSAVEMASRAPYRSRGLIEVSHPYLDRALVEFLQAIPHEQLIRAWQNRSLMRRSLRGLVPEKIIERRTKRYTTEPTLRAIRREWPHLEMVLRDARVQDYGYVDANILLTAMNRTRNGCSEYTSGILAVIPLEFWLRALEQRRSMAIGTVATGGHFGQAATVV
jgi:asparagine synthase (glutamine-hydrolysing)